MRGDYGGTPSALPWTFGPSPRAWGLLRGGNSRKLPSPGHPHVRGDYVLAGPYRPEQLRAIPTCVGTTPTFPPWTRPTSGPSPRAWGLRGMLATALKGKRAIPTCVGTTEGGNSRKLPSPGHPHVRGDYPRPSATATSPSGHPHVRGDYGRAAIASRASAGPSPRAWGLRYTWLVEAGAPGPSPRAWGLLGA